MRSLVSLLLSSLILIFLISVFFHTDNAITQDLGRHIVLGRIIWEKKSVPETNFFSYTNPDFPFINHHWGSEVIFYLINKIFSINGLIIIKIASGVLAFFLLFFFALKRTGFTSILFSSILAIELLRERTEIRPEIFAFLLFSLFLLILYREKEKNGKLIWFLPLLQLFWINIHISFIFGIVVYFLFFLDRLLLKKLKVKYVILGFLLLLSSLINPFRLKGLVYPLQIFQNYGYSIVENQSPFFLEQFMNNPAIQYFKISIVFFLLIISFLLMKKHFFETMVVVFFVLLSVFSIRHFPFFALSLLVPLSIGLSFAKEKMIFYQKLSEDRVSQLTRGTYLILSVFLVLEIFNLLNNKYYLNRNSPVRYGFGQVKGLEKTLDFFTENNLSGPIFNNFDIGSYLIYRLYLKERIFIDGRPEAYPASFFQNTYIPMQENYEIWENVNKIYRFNTIIWGHSDATPWGREFLKRIAKDKNWVLIFFDDYGVVFGRKGFLSSKINAIDNSQKLRDYGVATIKKVDQPDGLTRLANFFNLIGDFDLEMLIQIKMQSYR